MCGHKIVTVQESLSSGSHGCSVSFEAQSGNAQSKKKPNYFFSASEQYSEIQLSSKHPSLPK